MPAIAVVFASYRLPAERLHDHFKWNAAVYGNQVRVYVVSDVEHDLPSYAETIIIPEDRLPQVNGKPVFSLSLTKNAGIAKAIADGADMIVSTDVDISFDIPAWCVPPQGAAVIPIYRMAESHETRADGRLDHGCTGTVIMAAEHWRTIQYDERLYGYGKEDGALCQSIMQGGLDIVRTSEVAHIAHCSGDSQRTPGHGSDTCWNRASGFNPNRFRANLAICLALRQGNGPRIRRSGGAIP